MAKIKFTVNDKLYRKQMNTIQKYANKTMPRVALQEYKKNTPKDSGNARNKTKRRQNTIVGDYAYAGVLDDGLFPNPPKAGTGKTRNGYSTQATQGMATPTIKELTKQFNAFVRRVR
jgi:hypothetical protein